ncbi:hypothetical protein MB46_20010 (plasmid) [Arthrobacter alpinus]|uniref:MmyB family transcriptional regulator n=1 Tax=Arthrobacter alpinus TaxID=656366 RepID=UPI00067907A4|nr:hypothetical protein [Arthrobacter alpinus]ALV47812.1 hypothetical protein MB46_19210 [Arthrobacter alpinus]ALV47952.1 hypothetical protein MB46_20010 [Arthrobacter alpinus]
MYIRRLASKRRMPKRAAIAPSGQASVADGERTTLLQQLVDGMANPSYISDPFWTVVVMNEAAADIFDTRVGDSCLQRFFTDKELAKAHVHQEMMARSIVAQFRAQSAKFLDDSRFEDMANDLCEVSENFRELWQRQVVGDSYHVDIVFDHRSLGRLSFDPMVLDVPKFPTLRLFTYLPKNGTGTHQALARLSRNDDSQVPINLDASTSIGLTRTG